MCIFFLFLSLPLLIEGKGNRKKNLTVWLHIGEDVPDRFKNRLCLTFKFSYMVSV